VTPRELLAVLDVEHPPAVLLAALREAIAEADELRATLDNESGRGRPPSGDWCSLLMLDGVTWTAGDADVCRRNAISWSWHRGEDCGHAPTAREAMRQADAVRAGA
jgi:hypothetical protein